MLIIAIEAVDVDGAAGAFARLAEGDLAQAADFAKRVGDLFGGGRVHFISAAFDQFAFDGKSRRSHRAWIGRGRRE